MTAEIAILNRVAVALAADSAVTLSVRGQEKIYNSVDKLFHLSHSSPVALMIFGGAEFMGIPLETIIKGYRDTSYSKPKNTLKEYSESFFDYLEKEIVVPENLIESHIGGMIYEILYSIQQKVLNDYLELSVRDEKKKKNITKEFFQEATESLIAALINRYKKQPDAPNITETALHPNFAEIARAIAGEIFSDELYKDKSDSIVELAKLILIKNRFSVNSTGFVFAGFGDKEIFPKLQCYHSDGKIGAAIKKRETVFIDIDRNGTSSHIEPFAQKEMVERFLDGIDPQFDTYIKAAMKQGLREFGTELVNTYVKTNKKNRAEIINNINISVDKYLSVFSEKSEQKRKESFRQQVLDMVHYMPKTDLAAMAESLVNLTSIKRRVSAEKETVGGPIDVAVISKNDGFVWIKRKHYFSSELNPRYFVNQGYKLQGRRSPADATY